MRTVIHGPGGRATEQKITAAEIILGVSVSVKLDSGSVSTYPHLWGTAQLWQQGLGLGNGGVLGEQPQKSVEGHAAVLRIYLAAVPLVDCSLAYMLHR